MKLSKESQYAVAGLIHLARQPDGTVMEVGRIAAATALPAAYLAKIFRKLALHGVLTSQTGRGYMLASPASDITAASILTATEGPTLFTRCVFWGETCPDSSPCVFHDSWKTVRPQIAASMDATTLTELVARDTAST